MRPPRSSGSTTQGHSDEKLRATMTLLEDGISALLDGEQFRRYLQTLSRFHQYSYNNVALIYAQCPEATRVAGYRAWQQLGRQVKKGEKGIAIFVPHKYRVADEDDAASNVVVLRGFGLGYVFDVAQTEGEALPEPPLPQALATVTDRGLALWQVLTQWLTAQQVTVEVLDCGRPHGYYSPAQQHIVIHSRLAGTDQATKTLVHEAAHHVAAHSGALPREEVETVAESVAFVVLQHYGLDTSDFTFPYVAGWAQDTGVLKRNLEVIRLTASAIITGIAEIEVGDDETRQAA